MTMVVLLLLLFIQKHHESLGDDALTAPDWEILQYEAVVKLLLAKDGVETDLKDGDGRTLVNPSLTP
jgi:hypothetical protein